MIWFPTSGKRVVVVVVVVVLVLGMSTRSVETVFG